MPHPKQTFSIQNYPASQNYVQIHFWSLAVIFMSGAIIQYHDQFVMHVLHQQFMILHPIWFIQKQIWSFGFFCHNICVFIHYAGIVKGGHP